MISVLQSIFGEYTPLSYELEGVTHYVEGVSGLDIAYICGVVIFCILLCGVISALRVVLNKL